MLADEFPIIEHPGRSIAQWLLDRAVYDLRHIWACYWWALRAHVAATQGIPRSCLEDPPAEWLRVLRGPCEHDR